MSEQCHDVIVVGSGMGGSFVAAHCAEAGMSTLVLETGRTVRQARLKPGGRLARLKRKITAGFDLDPDGERWPQAVLLRRDGSASYREVKPFLGRGPGGSARIYGGALGRARPDDFTTDWQPEGWQPGADPALPNAWPIEPDGLQRHYHAAERILRVTGERDPLDPSDDALLRAPPPVSPAHGRIVEALRANGRHPFRMRVGIDYRPGCIECQGVTCPRDCKSHGFNRALEPAITRQAPVTIVERATVASIRRRKDGNLELSVDLPGGDHATYAARTVVLAAGALNTPRILQRSARLWEGGVPAIVGAGAMFHCTEIFAVSGLADGSLYGPRKVLAFRDHYREGVMPMAECQSMGLVPDAGLIGVHLGNRAMELGLPANLLTQLALRVPAEIAAKRFAGSELFCASMEDLPYADNRVGSVRGEDGIERIAITYRPRAEMITRVRRFRALMREAFAPLKVTFLSQPGEPNLGHPLGTCRMGSDPATSVVDADCQVWGQEGLYIADASVFPSSLGINPALTVAANAMRVAEKLVVAHGVMAAATPVIQEA